MKAKVLKYKFAGNTIVAPYMELEPYAENVFISLARKNEYGNESEDSFHVICKIGDVHFSCGQYSRRILDKEGHREEAAAKGTFNRHVAAIDRNGTVSFRKYKGRRTPVFTGCHKAVTDYLAFLAEDEISQ